MDTAEDKVTLGSSQQGLGLMLGWWPTGTGRRAVGQAPELTMGWRHCRPELSGSFLRSAHTLRCMSGSGYQALNKSLLTWVSNRGTRCTCKF